MEVNSFCGALRDFLEHSGVSQNVLAQQSGVSQSQISDWSKGKLTRFGKNPKKVMAVIESYRVSSYPPIPCKVLEAVSRFCQGGDEKADALIKMIDVMESIK